MDGWTPGVDNSTDKLIFEHFLAHGRENPGVLEALSQRLHDHAIDDALRDLLEGRIEGDGIKKVVGIMGGQKTPRTDPYYKKVARIAQEIAKIEAKLGNDKFLAKAPEHVVAEQRRRKSEAETAHVKISEAAKRIDAL